MYPEKFFKITWGIVLILTGTFLMGQLRYLFIPIQKLLAVLFFPILISGFFYYLFRPLLRVAEKFGISRILTIIFIFSLVIILIILIVLYAGSFIQQQFNQLIVHLPEIINSARIKVEQFLHSKNFELIANNKIGEPLPETLQKVLTFLGNHLLKMITLVADMVAVFALVPFILFYFLKDDFRFAEGLIRKIPKTYQNEVWHMLKESDRTLSDYIIGQVILALLFGVLIFIGYLIFGLHYSFILASFATATSFIPVLGTIIGIIPAILVALAQNPWLALKIAGYALIIHLLEGNLLVPHLIGERLKMHPLTIILLFLTAASLFGLMGILVIVPFYAVLKVGFRGAKRLYRMIYEP